MVVAAMGCMQKMRCCSAAMQCAEQLANSGRGHAAWAVACKRRRTWADAEDAVLQRNGCGAITCPAVTARAQAFVDGGGVARGGGNGASRTDALLQKVRMRAMELSFVVFQ